VKIGPELVALQETYRSRGFTVLGLNADKVLKLKYDDAYRAEYAAKIGVNFPNLHLSPEVRASLGNVNIFPTLFLVDSTGTIVNHFVNFQPREALSPATEAALPAASGKDR
jgi:glutathione peroxidase-family protein